MEKFLEFLFSELVKPVMVCWGDELLDHSLGGESHSLLEEDHIPELIKTVQVKDFYVAQSKLSFKLLNQCLF